MLSFKSPIINESIAQVMANAASSTSGKITLLNLLQQETNFKKLVKVFFAMSRERNDDIVNDYSQELALVVCSMLLSMRDGESLVKHQAALQKITGGIQSAKWKEQATWYPFIGKF